MRDPQHPSPFSVSFIDSQTVQIHVGGKSCKTCKWENKDMQCVHPNANVKHWSDVPVSDCWEKLATCMNVYSDKKKKR